MKRIMSFWILGAVVASITVGAAAQSGTAAQSESLGNYARDMKKEKKPEATKHFDNDNLPTGDKLSVVGKPAEESATPATDNKASNPSTQATLAQEQQKSNDEWKSKITTQKEKVDLLARELDVLQREYKLRAAAMYGDAGNRLRSAGNWDKEDTQYKEQIAQKQKDVDGAKQELENIQEQARKAGAPTSSRE
jgi:hypothetical protein